MSRILTAAALWLVMAAPALAETPQICTSQTELPPAVALQKLDAVLPDDVTISSADEAVLLQGFEAAIAGEPAAAGSVASIIAAGRPELVDQLRTPIEKICPDLASAIMEDVEDSANSPSPEELSALVNEEGSAPAAGDDGGEEEAGDEDPFDPALNDPTNSGSPS
jgi:hypothetical protein